MAGPVSISERLHLGNDTTHNDNCIPEGEQISHNSPDEMFLTPLGIYTAHGI